MDGLQQAPRRSPWVKGGKCIILMLLGLIKEPLPFVTTRNGGGPYKGGKPATKDTGQAEACLARPAIEVLKPGTKKAPATQLWRFRALVEYGLPHPATGLTVTDAL